MSQIRSFSSQSKSARFYLCSSQAGSSCAPSSRGSGKQLHRDAIPPSQRASSASQGLPCVTLARRARARSRAGTGSKFPFQKKISACILLYNTPIVSRLEPSSHSRNARFGIVSFGHTLLFFRLFQQCCYSQDTAFMLQQQKHRSQGAATDKLVKRKMQCKKKKKPSKYQS